MIEGNACSAPLAKAALDLARRNLRDICGRSWDASEKHQELCHPDTRIIVIKQAREQLLGYASYRLTEEEGVRVVYLYELHLEARARGMRCVSNVLSSNPHASRKPALRYRM